MGNAWSKRISRVFAFEELELDVVEKCKVRNGRGKQVLRYLVPLPLPPSLIFYLTSSSHCGVT